MYKTVALLRQTFHLVLYRDTHEELELWGMRQRKALKRGELTLLNAMELNNLRILDPEKLSRWSSLRFPETAGGSMCPEVGTWSSGPKPDPGAAFPLQQHGAPFLPLLAARCRRGAGVQPAPLLPHAASPCEVGCGVCLCFTVTPGGGLREEADHGAGAPPRHHCWPESLSFTFIFQKIEVTVASLLSLPPTPHSSLRLPGAE